MAAQEITDLAVATSVINEAKSHNAYPGDVPGDDTGKLKVANELLRLAEQAHGAGAQGAAVMAVLGAAAQQSGVAPANAPAANPFATAQQEPPPVAPAPVPTPEPAPSAPSDINSIIPDYDDLKVGDILTMMEGLTDEQIALVKSYESSDQGGERPKILNFERHPMVQAPPAAPPVQQTAPPTPEPAAGASGLPPLVDPSQYETVEPWPGYGKDKIPEITDKIEYIFLNLGAEAKQRLAHVWSYESKNKERTRLLGKLKEIAENGVQSAPPAAAPPTPEPAAQTPPAAPTEQPGVHAEPPFAPPTTQTPAMTGGDLATPEFEEMVAPLENKATTLAQGQVGKEGLPIPPSLNGNGPELPADFTALADIEVARLQSQFNACLARAHYLISIAEGHASDAKMVGDAAVRNYLAANEFPKGTTVAVMEAKASESPEVQHARRVQHEFSTYAAQLSHLRDTYNWDTERLSREQTRRDVERAAR